MAHEPNDDSATKEALTHLGKVSNAPVAQLEFVPWTAGNVLVTFTATEFTSICPVTGQRDFAQLYISYRPQSRLIETKSLKLYLWSFAERRAFNEEIVAAMAQDIAEQIEPAYLRIEGVFNTRGGIGVTAVCELSLDVGEQVFKRSGRRAIVSITREKRNQ